MIAAGIAFVLTLSGAFRSPDLSGSRFVPLVLAPSSPGHGPNLLNDIDEATYWLSLDRNPGQSVSLDLDFSAPVPVERIHWVATNKPEGAATPDSAALEISSDGFTYTRIPVSDSESYVGRYGNVFVRRRTRYVRLVLNSKAGGPICIDEIWGVPGHISDEIESRPKVNTSGRRIVLHWSFPPQIHPRNVRLLKGDSPLVESLIAVSTMPESRNSYDDEADYWTPTYYAVEALDNAGSVMLRSAPAVAVTHTDESRVNHETLGFFYDTYHSSQEADSTPPKVSGIPNIAGPSAEHAGELRSVGAGVLPYFTMYQGHGYPISMNKEEVAKKIAPEAFFRYGMQWPDSPPGYAPSTFSRPGNMEYAKTSLTYILDPNSVALHERIMAFVNKQLDAGAHGFFVDNGFGDLDVGTTICESPDHKHQFGQMTAADAYTGMLLEVRCAMKKKDPTALLIVNSGITRGAEFCGVNFWDVIDGFVHESFLCVNSPKHIMPWQGEYEKAKRYENFLSEHGYTAKVNLLCYPWSRDEAYLCYATTKLCNLTYAAYAGLKVGTLHRDTSIWPELLRVQLGPVRDKREIGGASSGAIHYREYEHGAVFVNPTDRPESTSFSPGGTRTFTNMYDGSKTTANRIEITMPPMSGRVVLY